MTERKSNFELLRIIAMLFVILSHIAVCGRTMGVDRDAFDLMSVFIHFSAGLGQIGNNLFILITGYFMVKSRFKIKKILSLVLQTLFYSWIVFLVFYLGKSYAFTRDEMIEQIFPIVFKTNWFVTAYLVLVLFSPFINEALHRTTKGQHLFLCLFTFFLWSILYIWKTETYLTDFSGMLEIYLIGSFLGLYPPKNKFTISGILALPLFLLFYVVLVYFGTKYDFFLRKADDFTRFYSIPCILVSLALFLWAKDWRIQSKQINAIATSVFGVYLLHYNFGIRKTVLPFLYSLLLGLDPILQILSLIGISVLIFIVCTVIEKIRSLVMEKLILQKIYPKIKLLDKIDEFFTIKK